MIWLLKMEGNKDDAAKCLKFAEKFIASGNKDKALKFLAKSIKLYPTKKAEGEVDLQNIKTFEGS